MKNVIYIFLFLLSGIAVAQNSELFSKGNVLYNDGKFQDAVKVYHSILDKEVHSSELYYNLANAYYKLNQTAPSIYYYEKALQLSPNDAEIKNNLSFAQNMTIDAIENVPEIGISRIVKNVINAFSFDIWAVSSIVLVLVFVILFLGYYFSYATVKKRIAFLVSSTAFCFSIVALFFAFQKYKYDQNNNPAIIFAQETLVKTEPNLRSETAFELHEGTKVLILEAYNKNWTKIKLADGKIGWISSQDIKAL